jgi:hypothetical protein
VDRPLSFTFNPYFTPALKSNPGCITRYLLSE